LLAGAAEPRLDSNGKRVPRARDALEVVGAAIVEVETGSNHEILDRARHENLAGAGKSGDAGAEVLP